MKRLIVKSLEVILYGVAVLIVIVGVTAGGGAGGFIGAVGGALGGFVFSVLLLGFFFLFLEMNQSLRDIRAALEAGASSRSV